MNARILSVAALGVVALGWIVLAGRRVSRVEANPGSESNGDDFEIEGVFDEFPETDNPEVVRLFLAWRLAEHLVGGGGEATLDDQLDLFGKLYRRIGKLTR